MNDHNLLTWERLHGLWRMLLNFNPTTVSSQPGQGLGAQVQQLAFPSHGNGNVSVVEDKNTSQLDKGVRALDIGDGFDNDAPNQV